MTKGTRLNEAQKEAIRADVILAKKNGRKMKEVAAKHNIHPTMISHIMNDGAVKAAKPRRKVAKRAAKKMSPDERKWQALFDKFIHHRDEAEKARKELENYVEKLR